MNWDAFEKRAYDFAHEKRELGNYYKNRSTDTPMDPIKAAREGRRGGAWAGGILGALTGGVTGLHVSGKAGLMGAGIGAGLGGLLGYGLGHLSGKADAMADKLGIQEAQRIVAMPKKDREEYLHHLARQNDISEQEAREWSRLDAAQAREEWRHVEREDNEDRRHHERMFYT